MIKYSSISKLFFSVIILAVVSCGGGNKANEEAKTEEENLPEDIVEMRADQNVRRRFDDVHQLLSETGERRIGLLRHQVKNTWA